MKVQVKLSKSRKTLKYTVLTNSFRYHFIRYADAKKFANLRETQLNSVFNECFKYTNILTVKYSNIKNVDLETEKAFLLYTNQFVLMLHHNKTDDYEKKVFIILSSMITVCKTIGLKRILKTLSNLKFNVFDSPQHPFCLSKYIIVPL